MNSVAGIVQRVVGHLPLAIAIMVAITLVDVAVGRMTPSEALEPAAIAVDFALALAVSAIVAIAYSGRRR